MSLDREELEELRRIGLFDGEFYAAAYRDLMRDGESALQHYLREGDILGLRPGPRFDPIVYRLRHPESSGQNALLHFWATRPGAGSWRRKLLHMARQWIGRATPVPAEEWPGAREHWQVKRLCNGLRIRLPRSSPAELLRNIENSPELVARMPDTCTVAFAAGGKQYRLLTPDPATFLSRFASNEPFAFIRLPHGFWDSLAALDEAVEQILAMYPGGTVSMTYARILGARLLKEQVPDNGTFEEHMVEEILECIPRHDGNPRYFRSVAFKGFPTPDENLFLFDDLEDSHGRRLRNFARHFAPEEDVYDATMWKRWLISGTLRNLPDLCRRHPLILVGPDSLSGLGQAWNHPDFSTVLIPRENTQRQRHELQARVADVIGQKQRSVPKMSAAPIVLFQCGGSFAYWLVARLFDQFPDVFYLDLGQALNAWCYDVDTNTGLQWNRGAPFCQLYLRAITRNCGLEPYYRRVMGARFDELLRRFPVEPAPRHH